MFKMSLITLISIYLILAIAGRSPDAPTHAPSALAAGDAQTAPIMRTTIGATEESAAVTLISTSEVPPAITPAVADTLPAPRVEPVRLVPMPGPALRPSPKYRATTAEAAPATGIWAVNTNSLNVRSGPSTSDSVVDRLSRGDEVLVTAASGDWVQIRIEGDGTSGWVAKRLLRPAR